MHKIDRRTFGKGALGLTFGAMLTSATACTSAGSTGGAGSVAGKTLTIAIDTEFGSFDPAKLASGGSVITVWQACFDTLLAYTADGKVVPNAAESFESNADKTQLTLRLRSGMTFTDGVAIDGNVVKACLEHMQTGGGPDASRLADVEVTVKDARTVVLTTPKPNGLLPTFLCLAPGILSSPASHKATDRDTRPVGSGPYKLDPGATTSGATWTFVRNESYWNKDAYPYDKVVVKQMTDITARVNALKSGQLSAAPITTQTEAEVRSSGLNVVENSFQWAGLFLADQQGKIIPALRSVKVRQAINMAFDRKAIVKALFGGHATATNQIFNDKTEAYLPEMLDYYPYDLAKAKALMAEAGYADGFEFELPVVSGLDYANPLIVQQLAKLNITAKQVKLPDNQKLQKILSGRYPIFFWTLGSRNILWDVVSTVAPNAIWNVNKDRDPRLQPLLDKAQILDGEAARQNAKAINKFLIENAWFCPWALPTTFYATDRKTSTQPTRGNPAPYLQNFKPA